jgi:hypothetical protein
MARILIGSTDSFERLLSKREGELGPRCRAHAHAASNRLPDDRPQT